MSATDIADKIPLVTADTRRARGRPPDPELVKRRRALLIQAATHVFAEVGYTKATVADITERAGLGKGTFYQYFDSKRDVFEAFFVDALEQLSQLISQETNALHAESVEDLEHTLRTLIQRLYEMVDDSPRAFQVMLEGVQDPEIKQRMLMLSATIESVTALVLRNSAAAGLIRSDIDIDFTAGVFGGVLIAGLLRILRGELADDLSRAKFVDSFVDLGRLLVVAGAQ